MIEIFNTPHKTRKKQAIEIAKVVALKPFAIEVNNVTYTSDDFPMFIPQRPIIRQVRTISADTTQAYVDDYDLELVPERRPMRFNIGDLVAIADNGNQIIILTALYGINKGGGI